MAVAADPVYATAYLNLGVALIREVRAAEALPVLMRGRRLDLKSGRTCNALGEAYRRLGRLDEAWRLFREATALEPDFAASHHNLASVHLMRGEQAQAISSLRAYLKRKPADREERYALAALLRETGQLDEAVNRFVALLREDESDPRSWKSLALALWEKEEHAAAAVAFRRCLRLEARDSGSHLGLAMSLEALGRFAEALRHLDAGWQFGDHDAAARRLLRERIDAVRAKMSGGPLSS
jgi:Flp pilus assembly protein TadD